MKTTFLHKAIIALVALASVTFTSCDSDVFNVNADPFKDSNYKSDLYAPISDVIDSDESLSEYAKALRYSGTYSALNQCTNGVSFTAFAPNNEAMAEFYSRRGVTKLEDLSPEYVRSFVLYHTVPDSINVDKFIQRTAVTNLLGELLPVAIDPEHAGQASLGDLGQIVEMGINAANGNVYILSRAVTPLVETVYDRLVESGATIMTQAVDASGWKADLSTVADTTVQMGISQITKRLYTFLNVSDADFAKAGISSLADLKARLKAESNGNVSDDVLLRDYVSYHVLPSSYTLSDFSGTDSIEATRLFNTHAEKQVLALNIDGEKTEVVDRCVFNKENTPASFVISASDVRATNGYLHHVDHYLPIWEPTQVEVVWDFADYGVVKGLVGENYQPVVAPDADITMGIPGANCYEYEQSTSGVRNNNLGAVSYVSSMVFSTGRGANKVVKTCYNNDRVVFNLGYLGWVKMQTPTLVRGKYKVEICVVRPSTLDFISKKNSGSNGGLIKVTFDDRDDTMTYAYPYLYVGSANGPEASVLIDEIEFDLTASHEFKMTIMDPAASSSPSFSFQVDYIKFTPID